MPGYCWNVCGGVKIIFQLSNQLVKRGHNVRLIFPNRIDELKTWKDRLRYLRNTLFYPPMLWAKLDSRIQRVYIPCPDYKHIPSADFTFITYWELYKYICGWTDRVGKLGYYAQHYEHPYWGSKDDVDACWKDPYFIKVCVSRWLIDIGKKLKATKLYYVPDAISHDVFRIHNLGERKRPTRFVFMYSTLKWKGSGEAIQILTDLKVKMPKLSVIAFGTDRRPRSLPLWMEYKRLPSQEELAKIYNSASHYLMMSEKEGFGLPGLEAKACGCKVMVRPGCGGPDDYMNMRPEWFNWERTTAMFEKVLNECVQT